jgi:ATP-dependent RNA helicase DeaD
VTVTTSSATETSGFEQLSLSRTMLDALAAAEYSQPTPIQAGLIPRALAGVDVLGQARTGTGKTAAFAIPILEKIDLTKKHAGPQALVLVPTRELAVQVREEVLKLSHGRKVHSAALYGGKPIRGQIDKLKKGVDVVVGTPGRVLDHLARGTLELRDLRVVVLDEADRMLDIGFRPDIERILKRCPESRQTLLLSATVPPPVERLSKRYMRDPETLNFSPKDVSVETIEQFYFTVEAIRKFDLLEKLLQREQPRQAIIFCRTKRGTERIYQRLSKKLPDAATIHGDLAQNARDRVMAGFRAGEVRYLVATDVVGRGIDVTAISHIINYDIPQFCDDYVHRVGRTGRMGREGVAYTFVTPEEGNELTRIEMRINRLLKRDDMPGYSIAGAANEPAALPTHTASGPAEWRSGAGWSDGNTPPPPDGQSKDEPSSPPPPATERPPTKRYRRAL